VAWETFRVSCFPLGLGEQRERKHKRELSVGNSKEEKGGSALKKMWVDPLELQDCSVDSAEEKGVKSHIQSL
jgi:hypothetical protein